MLFSTVIYICCLLLVLIYSPPQQEYALSVLAAIELGEEEGGIVHNLGGLLAIVSLLASGSIPMRVACLVILANLCHHREFR